MTLSVADFDYDLPPDLIAQHPLAERGASRLLVLRNGELGDHRFAELPGFLKPGDLLVINDTRVMRARLFGTKTTGGKVEVLVERLTGGHDVLAQLRSSHKPAPGSRLLLENLLDVEVVGREAEFFRLRFPQGTNVATWLERHGRLPLPPYIERAAAAADDQRYQTVYARDPGSVAAPTAGLHFDETLLGGLTSLGINIARLTLHVGAGTFQPVRVERLCDHHMHSERYSIPAETIAAIATTRAHRGRVVAVGTTSLRALESAASADDLPHPGEGETALFITPGYRFRVADALITNFHLPRSTLLMLVSAFGGVDAIRRAYAHAVAARYRFFSYGDAMLLTRSDQ